MAIQLSRFPLADVRIVAVEQYGAGPWATLQLAELGAEVIKIEDPRSGGDVGRYVPPFQEDEDSLFFEAFNHNKQSISLDLRTKGGRAVFEDLVAQSHAVFSNLRGDLPKRLRLTYADLASVNPTIVCCSLTGFGQSGSRATLPGYDYLMQGRAGWMSVTGERDSPPSKTGLSLVDFGGGYVAALALVAGLWQARRDGIGCDCDVSLYDTALSLLTYLGTWTATAGYEPRRTRSSAHPSLVPFQNFETSDGWIVIACPKDKFWRRLCDAAGLPELMDDDRFVDFAARSVNRGELEMILGERLRTRTTADWLAVLGAAGVPIAPVLDVPTALADPFVNERGLLVETSHPRFGIVRHVRSAVRVGNLVPSPTCAPRRGEHTDAVLTSVCGYSPEQIAVRRDQGAFGPQPAQRQTR